MKKINNIFEQVVSFDNLLKAYNKCLKGKREKENILNFNFKYELYLKKIQYLLKNNKYVHGRYFFFWKMDSKKRRIACATFKDKIVHYALYLILEPLTDKRYICDSYACRRDKGTHRAIKKTQRIILNNPDFYCLQCDIKKYFKSIDHNVLKNILRSKIGDKKVLTLLFIIIDSYNKKKGKSIPLGNLISQLFANMYLNESDQFVKHELRCKYYLRYMDDFLVFGDKNFLKDVSLKINNFVEEKLLLEIPFKKNQLYTTKQGVVFLGFVIEVHRLRLKKKSKLKIFRNIFNKFSEDSFVSYLGYISFSKNYYLNRKLMYNMYVVYKTYIFCGIYLVFLLNLLK